MKKKMIFSISILLFLAFFVLKILTNSFDILTFSIDDQNSVKTLIQQFKTKYKDYAEVDAIIHEYMIESTIVFTKNYPNSNLIIPAKTKIKIVIEIQGNEYVVYQYYNNELKNKYKSRYFESAIKNLNY